jgi:hypothetical protein
MATQWIKGVASVVDIQWNTEPINERINGD